MLLSVVLRCLAKLPSKAVPCHVKRMARLDASRVDVLTPAEKSSHGYCLTGQLPSRADRSHWATKAGAMKVSSDLST